MALGMALHRVAEVDEELDVPEEAEAVGDEVVLEGLVEDVTDKRVGVAVARARGRAVEVVSDVRRRDVDWGAEVCVFASR